MPTQDPQVASALGSLSKTAPLPGCILTLRVASMGSLQRLELRRYTGDVLTDGKQFAWVSAQLSPATMAEMENVMIDQLRLAILAHYGVEADLFEGLTP